MRRRLFPKVAKPFIALGVGYCRIAGRIVEHQAVLLRPRRRRSIGLQPFNIHSRPCFLGTYDFLPTYTIGGFHRLTVFGCRSSAAAKSSNGSSSPRSSSRSAAMLACFVFSISIRVFDWRSIRADANGCNCNWGCTARSKYPLSRSLTSVNR